MATLVLTNLHCRRRNDLTGYDEPRIKLDGEDVWNGAVQKDGDVDLRPTIYSFNGTCSVSMQEMDNQKAQPTGAPVTVRESGNPNFLTFKTSGTWYELHFTVTPTAPATEPTTAATH